MALSSCQTSPRRRSLGVIIRVYSAFFGVFRVSLAAAVASSASAWNVSRAQPPPFQNHHYHHKALSHRHNHQPLNPFSSPAAAVNADEAASSKAKASFDHPGNDDNDDDDILLQERLLAAAIPRDQFLLRQDHRHGRDLSNDDYYAADPDDDGGASATDDATTSSTSSLPTAFLTSYALKYVGCQNIKSWRRPNTNNYYYSDASSSTTDGTVLSLRSFVTLRLCPHASCSSYNQQGCQNSNYGEYLLPAETYLAIMKQYHVDQLSKYCSTCAACTSFQAPTAAPTTSPPSSSSSSGGSDDYYAKYYGQRDMASSGSSSSSSYDYNAAGDDGYFNDDIYTSSQQQQQTTSFPWYIDTDGTCMYQTVCKNYKYPCKSYESTTTTSSSTSTSSSSAEDALFQCTAYSYDAAFYYFAAPHCASDGKTLQLGLFADSSCGTLVRTSTSFGLGSRPLFSPYVDKTCIPCNTQESIALITDQALQADEGGSLQTNPLCSNMFYQAAQCNKHLTATTTTSSSSSTTTTSLSFLHDDDDLTCPYIEALRTNKYDESGDVYIPTDYEFANWKQGTEYIKLARMANFGQLVALFLSVCVAGTLAGYAIYLQKKLWYRKAWQPPRDFIDYTVYGGDDDTDHPRRFSPRMMAGRLSRLNSGIVALRSRSSSDGASPSHKRRPPPPPGRPYQPYGAPIPHRSSTDDDHAALSSGFTNSGSTVLGGSDLNGDDDDYYHHHELEGDNGTTILSNVEENDEPNDSRIVSNAYV